MLFGIKKATFKLKGYEDFVSVRAKIETSLPGMKQLYLVANWKSNKTIDEARDWILQIQFREKPDTAHVILCAPFTVLSVLKTEIEERKLPISLGAETVSTYPDGAYTGEISASMLKGLVEYVIIGHSERRRYFHETDEELTKKAEEAQKNGLKIIYCVEGLTQPIPEGVTMVLYEPKSAIGSGTNENSEISNTMCEELSKKNHGIPVLYGGSVTEKTIHEYVAAPSISGVGVGGASLNPEQFMMIIDAASWI